MIKSFSLGLALFVMRIPPPELLPELPPAYPLVIIKFLSKAVFGSLFSKTTTFVISSLNTLNW